MRGSGCISRGGIPMQDDIAIGTPIVVTAEDAAVESMQMLRRLLHHPRPGEGVKAQIVRAARLAGLDPERVREIWYLRAVVKAHEHMQLAGRLAQKEARVNRLLDRLAGMVDAPGLPPDMRVADALALAELVPGVEPWARKLAHGARALVVVCLLSLLPQVLLSDQADARPVRRGGPACAKVIKTGARSCGPQPVRVPIIKGGLRHA
jgi:hypothetical protein